MLNALDTYNGWYPKTGKFIATPPVYRALITALVAGEITDARELSGLRVCLATDWTDTRSSAIRKLVAAAIDAVDVVREKNLAAANGGAL